ncbi:hypothetical protein, variant 1 [Aphanomyces invadans]|uniref:Sel1 repeat family protein n=1 Tax=Aphanomyces invadans TaxID=157072 RepID=A0A024UKJ5_9STRA|nr:hypothetical protein, variant 1 [Aphanomyces invadans]ETW06824.1 hypothetical protein, variant 1 [Aphanomyces invadans]|eukprot:XP_008864899.1 hypothetical protein, variant 1 [Aphanomyces invadans]
MWHALLACVVILALRTSHVGSTMQFDLGKRYGLGISNPNAPMHEGALRQIMNGVRQERPDAMYLFGLMQFYGHGVAQDKDAGVRFFRKAAADRHVDAQFALGLLHYKGGDGVVQDDSMAYSFLKPAADKGHADSQWLLGTMLRDGRGPRSSAADSMAFELIRDSAAQGNPHGQFHLGVYYEYGTRHVAQNLTAAAQLYALASAQHVPDAAFYLGLMHAYGRGVRQDVEQAVGLFNKAASMQHGPAMYYLGLMHVHGDGGLSVDYTRGLYWFDMALATKDKSIAENVQHARDELAALVAQASAHRAAVLAGR